MISILFYFLHEFGDYAMENLSKVWLHNGHDQATQGSDIRAAKHLEMKHHMQILLKKCNIGGSKGIH